MEPVDVPGAEICACCETECAAEFCKAPIIEGDAVDYPVPEMEMHWTCAKDWRVEVGTLPDYRPTREELIAKWTIFDRAEGMTKTWGITIAEIVDAVREADFFGRQLGQDDMVSFHLERGRDGKLVAVEDVSFPLGLKGLDHDWD